MILKALIVILAPGTYSLAGDIEASEKIAVQVAADDVTFDLGGHVIKCAGDETYGIYARGADRLIVRNGAITGCRYGIEVSATKDVTIEYVNFTGTVGIGVAALETEDLTVRRSIFGQMAGWDGYAVAINGSPSQVEANSFIDLYPPEGGEAVGILLSAGSSGATIRNNRLSNSREDFDTIGVWIGEHSSSVLIEGNEIDGFGRAILAGVTQDVTVTGNTLRGWSEPGTMGVHLWNCAACRAEGNSISGFETAINQQ